MGNANGSIDEIIGQEARNQVKETTDLLKLMVEEFKVAVTQAKTLNTEISNAKGLAQMTTALEKMNITTAKATEATNKAAVAYEKLRQQEQITATKLEQTATQQAKTDKEKVNIEKAKLDLRLKEEAAAQKAIANLAKETKAAEIQASAYIKLRDAHKLAEKVALEAGVTYGKNSEQFKLAAAESNKLRDQFVGLHKELGNNRDNVGNYGSALTKVWGGVRQLAYILPGLGIAGIFNLAGEAILYAADKMGVFSTNTEEVKTAVDELSESFDRLNKTTEFAITYADRDLKLALANAKKRGASIKELAEIENKYAKEKVAAISIQIDKENELIAGYYRQNQILERQGGDRKNVLKAIKDGEEKVNQLMEKRSDLNIDIQVRTIDAQTAQNKKDSEPVKEVNRIDDIKKQYEKELNLLEESHNLGTISDEKYYDERATIAESFYNHRKGLTEKESLSEAEFNAKLTGESKKMYDELLKLLDESVTATGKADWEKLQSGLKRIANLEKGEADYTKYVQDQLDAQARMAAEDERQREADMKLKMGRIQATAEAVMATIELISTISDIATNKQLASLDAKEKALDDYYKNELKFIEQSGMSSAQKEKIFMIMYL